MILRRPLVVIGLLAGVVACAGTGEQQGARVFKVKGGAPVKTTPHRVTVRGILVNEPEQTVLVECGLKTRYSFGEINEGQLYYYRRRIEGILERESKTVTAEVSGYLSGSPGDFVLHRPAFLHLVGGECSEDHDKAPDADP